MPLKFLVSDLTVLAPVETNGVVKTVPTVSETTALPEIVAPAWAATRTTHGATSLAPRWPTAATTPFLSAATTRSDAPAPAVTPGLAHHATFAPTTPMLTTTVLPVSPGTVVIPTVDESALSAKTAPAKRLQ